MQLFARWTNKESWGFHIKDKGIVREYIAKSDGGEGDPSLEGFEQMEFRREWMQDDGEGNPPNYDLLKSIASVMTSLREARLYAMTGSLTICSRLSTKAST